MTDPDEEFRQILLATFREDAHELLSTISEGLIDLEKKSPNIDPVLIEKILRDTHSLKGASHAVHLQEIESVSLNLEHVFLQMQKGLLIPDADIFELFYSAITILFSVIRGEPGSEQNIFDIIQLLKDLEGRKKIVTSTEENISHESGVTNNRQKKSAFSPINPNSYSPGYSNTVSRTADIVFDKKTEYFTENTKEKGEGYDLYHTTEPDTIRIPGKKFERLISASDNLSSTQIFISHRLIELENLLGQFDLWHWNHDQIYNNLHVLEEILSGTREMDLPPDVSFYLERVIDFLKKNKEFISALEHDLAIHTQSTAIDRAALEVSTNRILRLIQDAVLVPLSSILSSFPALVRDNSRSLGKLIELVITGEEIEMDRRILESLRLPLMHLLYNCIDYGIEHPAIRLERKKSKTGRIQIEVFAHSGSNVRIDVSDDGAGIDSEKIKNIAIKKGFITHEEAQKLTDEEAVMLIFISGFSTRNTVSGISGRGLGMAIIKDTILRLGGNIQVVTNSGFGTRFSLIMPMKRATMRGLLVESEMNPYILPIHQVKQVLRIHHTNVYQDKNSLFFKLQNDTVKILSLRDSLGLQGYPRKRSCDEYLSLVIIAYANKQIAFIVDEVVWVQDIVVRSLGTQLRRIKGISGAVILGDGRLALILDPSELLEQSSATILSPLIHPDEMKQYRILVVEDSVTLRTMMTHLIQKEGYQVTTAVNGVEALQKLQEEEYDLVISDVDMPKMNGFTLTEKMKSLNRTKHVPVILVTALDSPQDIEYGFLIGAYAYVSKRTFNEGSFLTIIQDILEQSQRS